jgi:ketosteroid isomerase-like protein
VSNENVERLRAAYAAMADGDFTPGADLFAADVLFEPMADGRRTYVGREAVAEQMRQFLGSWSEYRIEAQEFVEVGDAVVVTERQHGRGKSSGIETEMTFFAVWTFRDGLVVRARWESDRAEAMRAAG